METPESSITHGQRFHGQRKRDVAVCRFWFVVLVFAPIVLGGCPNPPGGIGGDVIAFNVENASTRNFIEVVIKNNSTGKIEPFDLTDDPIVNRETRGFCCFTEGFYDVTVVTDDNREVTFANLIGILDGEELLTLQLRIQDSYFVSD